MSLFNDSELSLLQGAMNNLAKRNFASTRLSSGEVVGPLFGLTNERVADVQRKTFVGLTELSPDDAYVLYCATLELRFVTTTVEGMTPLAIAALPVLEQLHGKIHQMRGFDNKATDELLNSRHTLKPRPRPVGISRRTA